MKIKRADVRFSRRSLREAINWGDTQTKLHLSRLVELEYLVAHRTKTGGNEYELVYDVADAEGSLRFPGLADIEALSHAYDATRSGRNDARSALSRGLVGPRSAGGRGAKTAAEPAPMRLGENMLDTDGETHLCTTPSKRRPYPHAVAAPSLAAAGA